MLLGAHRQLSDTSMRGPLMVKHDMEICSQQVVQAIKLPRSTPARAPGKSSQLHECNLNIDP